VTQVTVALSVPGHTPDEALHKVADYERYPDLTESVIAVQRVDLGGGRYRASWTVRFRRGILKWTEEGTVKPDQRRLEFALVDGDLDALHGHWEIDPAPQGCAINFWCEFDVGIPSLAALIDPVAASALRDNVIAVCRGLFGAVEVMQEDAPSLDGRQPG